MLYLYHGTSVNNNYDIIRVNSLYHAKETEISGLHHAKETEINTVLRTCFTVA